LLKKHNKGSEATMPFSMPQQLVELDGFLATLRINGVPVGPADIDRLRRLFALEPRLDRNSLKTLLSALLVKTPVQRETFETLFADWCPDHEADWSNTDVVEREVQAEQPETRRPSQAPPSLDTIIAPPPPARSLLRWLAAALLVVLVGALLAWWWPRPIPPTLHEPLPRAVSVPPTPDAGDPDALPATPVDTVWLWQADVDTSAIHAPWRLGPLAYLLLCLAALATAGAAWWRYRKQLPAPPPESQSYVGYGWQPLPIPERDDGALIEARDRRQLVWNIEHFVSDDPTHRLHLPRTVEATAKAGGYVHLHFTPAVYNREIWFWLDRQVERSTPRAMVQQLTATLAAAGLQARQGWFTDVPDRVDWPEQHGYRPVYEEGSGRQALVAIFSDGEGLAQRLNNPLYHPATTRLLRDLRHWPRLCFVDCSPAGDRLASLLARFGLEVIALEAVSRWLGGVAAETPGATPLGSALYGDARVWAAAVALGGTQVDTASAHSLRVALRLRVSPWLVDQMVAEAHQSGEATRHVNWLLRCEPLGASGLPPPWSLARRALRWWWQRYAEAGQRMQAQENPLLPWQHSLARRRWELEQALLQLYLDPRGAAQQLAQLVDDELKDEVYDRLARFAADEHRRPDGRNDAAYIFLTWRFDELPAATRYTLRQLGFAAVLFKEDHLTPLKHASRLVLAGTMLVMLALSAFGFAAYRWMVPEPPRLVTKAPATYEHPAFKAQTIRVMERTLDGTYRVTLGSARDMQMVSNVPEDAEMPVQWRWQAEPNATVIPGSNTVLLRAGRLAQPIRPCSQPWPQRSLVVIAASYQEDVKARQLAIRLLDTGSADQVLIGADWEQPLVRRLESSAALNQDTQVMVLLPDGGDTKRAMTPLESHPGPWAVVSSGDFAALARAVTFAGTKTLDPLPIELREQLQVHRRQGDVCLVGGPEEPQTDPQTGIAWVRICSGTFTMGTVAQDGERAVKMASPSEMIKDATRTVILPAFDMAATETTDEQCVKIDPDQRQKCAAGSTRPVVNIDWNEARAVCQKAQSDLPTEAQWEYAARGGSRFPWSFGDDEGLLKYYAWYGGNAKDVQETGQRRSNPLGLYDMHGNAWEWVRDWFGAYDSGVAVNPVGPASGSSRVVRGGSFFNLPANLRSADRGFVPPESGGEPQGFRCVRVPPALGR
jgi:formylglycine-generating enzyme required for sulfatase activity